MCVLSVIWSRVCACALVTLPARAWGFLLPPELPFIPLLVKWDAALPICWTEGDASAMLSGGQRMSRPSWWFIAEVSLWGLKMDRKRPHPHLHPVGLYASSPCRLEPVFSLSCSPRLAPTHCSGISWFSCWRWHASASAAYFNPRILSVWPHSVTVWLPLHICSNLYNLRAESRYHKYCMCQIPPLWLSLYITNESAWWHDWLELGVSH